MRSTIYSKAYYAYVIFTCRLYWKIHFLFLKCSVARLIKLNEWQVRLQNIFYERKIKINFNITIYQGYVVKIKFLYIFKCFDHLWRCIYQISGLPAIHVVSYRLLLYCPAYENAFINIFIIIRLFIIIK